MIQEKITNIFLNCDFSDLEQKQEKLHVKQIYFHNQVDFVVKRQLEILYSGHEPATTTIPPHPSSKPIPHLYCKNKKKKPHQTTVPILCLVKPRATIILCGPRTVVSIIWIMYFIFTKKPQFFFSSMHAFCFDCKWLSKFFDDLMRGRFIVQ